MEKKKIEIIATSALVVVFIILLLTSFSKRKPAGGNESVTESTSQQEPSVVVQRQSDNKEILYSEDKGWGRDPFVLAPIKQVTAKNGPNFVLSAIIWDENEPYAVINGEIVEEGQNIGGYNVVRIDQEDVILIKGYEEVKLEIFE